MTKRQAIAETRALADLIIEQRERQDKGWDRGVYRDDDTQQLCAIERRMRAYSQQAFEYSKRYN